MKMLIKTYGAIIALAGPWIKSAWFNQQSSCLDNSGPIKFSIRSLH